MKARTTRAILDIVCIEMVAARQSLFGLAECVEIKGQPRLNPFDISPHNTLIHFQNSADQRGSYDSSELAHSQMPSNAHPRP
jgi:hypothetical protein